MNTTLQTNADYWRKLCPDLHLNDKKFQSTCIADFEQGATKQLSQLELSSLKKRLCEEGYFALSSSVLRDCFVGLSLPAIVRSLAAIVAQGHPASFFNVFDEAWVLVQRMGALMQSVAGNELNFDMLSWSIDPSKQQAGFSPHRDRQPEDVAASFRADATPKYSTCWVALSEAHPENSCLYVIPAQCDPGYFKGDGETDPLQAALPTKNEYQNLRALPLSPGGAVFFSHRIIHWGSAGRAGTDLPPRLSFSFACSDNEFEPSYLDRTHLPFPSFELRHALTSAQMICYYDRFNFTPDQLRFFYEDHKSQKQQFHKSYQCKVGKEYVAAMKEFPLDDARPGNPGAKVDALSEDHIDRALAAMLETMEDGQGGVEGMEFEDDFDALNLGLEADASAPASVEGEDSMEDDDVGFFPPLSKVEDEKRKKQKIERTAPPTNNSSKISNNNSNSANLSISDLITTLKQSAIDNNKQEASEQKQKSRDRKKKTNDNASNSNNQDGAKKVSVPKKSNAGTNDNTPKKILLTKATEKKNAAPSDVNNNRQNVPKKLDEAVSEEQGASENSSAAAGKKRNRRMKRTKGTNPLSDNEKNEKKENEKSNKRKLPV